MDAHPIPAAHRIRIAGSDAVFDCADGDTLLRAAQRAGLGFPYECNVGSCGNCKFELVEGALQMAWEQAPGWTDKDRARKRYLGCQAQPLGACGWTRAARRSTGRRAATHGCWPGVRSPTTSASSASRWRWRSVSSPDSTRSRISTAWSVRAPGR